MSRFAETGDDENKDFVQDAKEAIAKERKPILPMPRTAATEKVPPQRRWAVLGDCICNMGLRNTLTAGSETALRATLHRRTYKNTVRCRNAVDRLLDALEDTPLSRAEKAGYYRRTG